VKGNLSLGTSISNNEKELLKMLYPADTTRMNNPSAPRGVGPRFTDTLHTAQSMARNYAAQEENRSRLTLNSFVRIGEYLSGYALEGPVALLYVSGGFPIRPGEQYFDLVQQALERQFTEGPGDLAMMERPRIDFQNELRRMIGDLNRLNVTIYSLDAKGLLMHARGAERNGVQMSSGMDMMARNYQLQDSLVLLARETGGIAFVNAQNFSKGLAEIVRDMSEQYLLCGELKSTGKKGDYHKITVRVTRPDVQLRHRKGYSD
jgi:VWFA-related protein